MYVLVNTLKRISLQHSAKIHQKSIVAICGNIRNSSLAFNNSYSTQEKSSPATQVEQIYYGTLAPKIKAVKVFSLTTSLAGLAAQPILIEHGAKIGSTPLLVFMCGFVGFFTFVTPVFLHFITKKYVCQIDYDRTNQEYTATTISLLLTKTKVSCNLKMIYNFRIYTAFCIEGKR